MKKHKKLLRLKKISALITEVVMKKLIMQLFQFAGAYISGEIYKTNIFPIIIEVIFIISCLIVPKEYYIYTNFCFYLTLTIYFGCRKDFSLKEWLYSLKGGKKFWESVILTALGFVGAFVITTVLESRFSEFNTGMIGLRRNSWITLIIFAISTILLPPIVEETFYRKNMI